MVVKSKPRQRVRERRRENIGEMKVLGVAEMGIRA
jgi:hypothetical protein